MNTRTVGGRGEKIAADYLLKRGYRILARNFRIKSGEIDLVAMHKGCVCFIEVKSRKTYATPQEAVSRLKQRKLTRLAQAYLQEYYGSIDVLCRFDVVAIEETLEGQIRLELFENAFDAVY